MVRDIHVRVVDDRLAEAAKVRAKATHRSLSAYVRDLIERDLAQDKACRAMGDLLAEIAGDRERPHVPRTDTAATLADVHREPGIT